MRFLPLTYIFTISVKFKLSLWHYSEIMQDSALFSLVNHFPCQLYIPFFIYVYQAHIHILKVKSPVTSSVSYLGSQPAKICSKKLRV